MSNPILASQPLKMPEPLGFSTADGINVVVRSIATGTECLLFAGRKVTRCMATGAGWFFGGIKGTLRYAHENLGNRSVHVPQEHAATPPAQPSANPPWETYLINDAIASADSFTHYVLTAHPRCPLFSGENLGSVAFTFLVPYCLFGPLGSVLLNLPRMCGARPYITFEASSDTPCTQPGTATANPETPCHGLYPGQYGNHHQNPYTHDHRNSANRHN